MSKISDGGQAFPIITWKRPDGMIVSELQYGMSLRDWFAGQALMGIIAGKVPLAELNDGIQTVIEAQAQCAYMIADAMIVQRFHGRA